MHHYRIFCVVFDRIFLKKCNQAVKTATYQMKPDGTRAEFRQRIPRSIPSERTIPMKHTSTRLFALLFALLTLLAFVSCSKSGPAGSAGNSDSSAPSYEKDQSGLVNGDADVPINAPDIADRKIIKTYEINSETKEYDAAIASLQQLVADCGGYVESSSTSDKSLNNTSAAYSRYAQYTIRIPADQAEEFVGTVGTLFNVTSNNSYVEDVSETYYSIEARLEELQAERDSLLDMMNATETKQDYSLWLTVSQRLSEVRQEIAVYQGQLNRYDSLVAYSTVKLSISEVLNYTAVANSSFSSRLGNSFVEGLQGFWQGVQNFLIWFVGALPVLVLLAAAAVAVVLVIRRARRKRKQ